MSFNGSVILSGLIFVLLWNTYRLYGYCSSTSEMKCLTEISDSIALLLLVILTYPLTTRYADGVKVMNLVADLLDSSIGFHGKNIINEILVGKLNNLSCLYHLSLLIRFLISCLFAYYNAKSSQYDSVFLIVVKYSNLLLLEAVYIGYINFFLMYNEITKLINENFELRMKNALLKRKYGIVYVCVQRYLDQFALQNKF